MADNTMPGLPAVLLERRRRPEKALISVVADLYLAGVSTRRVEKAVAQLGVESISKSQVSRLAGELDELVEAFRTREGNGHGTRWRERRHHAGRQRRSWQGRLRRQLRRLPRSARDRRQWRPRSDVHPVGEGRSRLSRSRSRTAAAGCRRSRGS
jgi:hypothetical protein